MSTDVPAPVTMGELLVNRLRPLVEELPEEKRDEGWMLMADIYDLWSRDVMKSLRAWQEVK